MWWSMSLPKMHLEGRSIEILVTKVSVQIILVFCYKNGLNWAVDIQQALRQTYLHMQ